jgi:hypothetical protein
MECGLGRSTMSVRSMIVLEANEIPFRIFDYFCARRPASALAKLMGRSRQYRAHAEDKARFIMPWTTWPSFHRGVHDEVHRIFKFGQWEAETDIEYPPIWSLLVRNGIRTGVFSSMQSSPLPANGRDYAFYLPDMFATTADAQPEALETLQEFNLLMTRESARNISRRIDLRTGARVILNSGKLGLRARTYLDVGTQLVREVINPARKTRRRAYQPMMLLDAFCRQLERTKPQFSTFFTNHVAAAMHRYWAAAFPGDYDDFQLDGAWVKRYAGEIEFAMGKLDDIVRRLVSFVDTHEDYMLVIATSMGQAAIPAKHVREFLTIVDVKRFMARFNLAPEDFEERPAMVPDFSFRVSREKADDFHRQLEELRIEGKPAGLHRDGSFFHVSVYNERPHLTAVRLAGSDVPLQEIGLGYLIHEDEVACTAQHVPEGSLIVYSPHSGAAAVRGERTDVSALDFAPSVLRHFGLEAPRYMRRAELLAGC